MQQQPMASNSTRVLETGPAQYNSPRPMPGYLPNPNSNQPRLSRVDHYGPSYNTDHLKTAARAQPFYTNPAFEKSQQSINFSHLSQRDEQPPAANLSADEQDNRSIHSSQISHKQSRDVWYYNSLYSKSYIVKWSP
jgi:hypothetical protein